MPAGWKQLSGCLGGEVGGRERCLAAGEAGCWSRQCWLGQTAAHQTCSLAFPHSAELVLVLPETSLLHCADRKCHSLHTAGV